ncbi:MAG: hypothetical protein ACFCVH_03345 [Alphaproteobacteria bacterium]
MIRASILLWLVLIAGAGAALYQLKYRVIALEDQLAGVRGEIEADRDAIAMLHAEWSYLNDPAQIESYATQHLGTRPSTVRDIVALADIPMAAGQVAPIPPRPGPDGAVPLPPALTPERDPAPGSRTPPSIVEEAADGLLMADADVQPPAPELALVPAGRAAPEPAAAAGGPDDAIGALIANVLHERPAVMTAGGSPAGGATAAVLFPRGIGQ